MNKHLDEEGIYRAINLCRELNIKSTAFILLGSPTESIKDMRISISFIKKLNPDYIDINLSVPIVGSKLYTIWLRENKFTDDIWKDIAEGIFTIFVHVPAGVSLSEMRKIQRTGYLQHYFNIRNIIREIRNINNLFDVINKFKIVFILLLRRR